MILELLDMTEEEQQGQIINWAYMNMDSAKYHAFVSKMPESLADLAFRLRDEILNSENGTIKWVAGMFDVYMKMTGSKLLNWKWGYIKAKPIHWIIAALIAKEAK